MAIERSVLYDKSFQEKLAAHLVRCPHLLRLIETTQVSQDDFDFPVIRAIIQACVGIIKLKGHSREGISQVELMDQLVRMSKVGGIQASEIPAVATLVAFIYRTDLAPDLYFPQVKKFLGHQRVLQAMAKHSIHDIDSLPEKISRELDRSKIDQKGPIMPLLNFRRTARVVPVPTGLQGIDIPMNGGLGKKEYGILCAYTGVGKTSLGLNFAYGAARQGFKVAFATLELDEDKITDRLYSLVGQYSYQIIRDKRDASRGMGEDEVWAEVEEKVKANSSIVSPNGRSAMENLLIWDFSKETCSISTLEDYTRREMQREPEHPIDMLIVDWLLCLDERPGSDPRALSGKEVRHKLQRYSDDLSKRLAMTFDMAVWATHQADAKAENEDRITMAHAAEGKSVGWKCSAFLGVGASKQGRDSRTFTVNAAKMRDGRLFTCKLKERLDEQRFEDYDEPDPLPEGTSGVMRDMAEAAQARPLVAPEVRRSGHIIAPPG